ncbi:hypothetical protein [Synechococcus sp. CCY 9618]|uniref:hypothetical protein n=1 Tax=Synechococcus sp. CCY 9618 TaxID=2815602 RepID=UPI001C2204FD|nr:hypothetical protein [Synechococcus sp. CCY 9618]
MTNLQDGASRLSGATLRRLWFLVPAGALGGLGLLVILGGLLPLWSSLQRDSQRLQELEQIRDQVTLMRSQLTATRENTQAATDRKAKIVELITGNGDLSTFVAMLDREATATGVQLNLFEPAEMPPGAATPGAPTATPGGTPPPPAAAPAPAPGTPPAQGGAPAAQPGPLALEGLSLKTLLVSARGSFPALLAFLRRLEELNVLVVQSNLNLTLPDAKGPDGKPLNADVPVVLKLSLGLYSRSPSAPPAPGGTAVPAPAPAPSTQAPPN